MEQPSISQREPTDDRYKLAPGMYANKVQREAIDAMINFLYSEDKEYLLIGRGGTGKSTVISRVIKFYRDEFPGGGGMFGEDVVCATISHAAKNVLRKFLDDTLCEVVTVARLLGMKQSVKENGEIEFTPDEYSWKRNPPIKDAYLLIVDECSMISRGLMHSIYKYKNKDAKIIFMGDNVQLPPIDSEREPNEDSPTFTIPRCSKLIERIRQGEDSPILPITDIYANNIERFNETADMDINPLKEEHCIDSYDDKEDRGVLFRNKFKDVLHMLLKDFKTEEGKNNPHHCKAIAYRNKNPYGRATYNIGSINATIRKHLWNTTEQFVKGDIVIANNNYMPGRQVIFHNSDSMIVTHVSDGRFNNIEVVYLNLRRSDGLVIHSIPVISRSGSKGYKELMDEMVEKARDRKLPWKRVYDFKGLFAAIGYGYAVNSHKAQGSTYRNVYVFEDDIFGVGPTTPKEKNQSMYVACTRASHKLVIFSERFKLDNHGRKEG